MSKMAVMAAAAGFVTAWWCVGRFVVPVVALESWIPDAARNADAAIFATHWPLYAVYAVAALATLATGAGAVQRAVTHGAGSTPFLAAALVTALAGMGLSAVRGDDIVGGDMMIYFWVGFGVLWLVAIARAWLADRRGEARNVRDWTVYCFALALVPASMIVQAPAWNLMPTMSPDEAWQTAGIIAFAGHYMVAHYVVVERLTSGAAGTRPTTT